MSDCQQCGQPNIDAGSYQVCAGTINVAAQAVISELQAQVTASRAREAALRARVEALTVALERERDAALAQVAELERERDEARSVYHATVEATRDIVASLYAQIDAAQADKAALQARVDELTADQTVLIQRLRYVERMNYSAQRQIRGMEERGAAVQAGDTVRLMCLTTGAFRGLVRAVSVSEGLCTVTAETPILDWLTTGEHGEYPYQTWEIGHRFNADRNELRAILAAASGSQEGQGDEVMEEG